MRKNGKEPEPKANISLAIAHPASPRLTSISSQLVSTKVQAVQNKEKLIFLGF